MNRDYVIVLIGLGVLGLLKFGLILLATKASGAEIRDLLQVILTERRRRRFDWWVRVAPVGLAASATLVVLAGIALATGFTTPL